jgi:hypothetical protein
MGCACSLDRVTRNAFKILVERLLVSVHLDY